VSSAPAAVKRRIRSLLYTTGISAMAARMRRRMRILMLHGVGVPEFDAAAFEEIVVYLKREFRPIGLVEALAELEAPSAGARPPVVLTFDDGLANNVTVAYPILKRHAVPAAFFVCPGLIDAGRWLWTHETRARLAGLDAHARRAAAPDAPAFDIESIVRHLKALTPAERAARVEAIRAATPSFAPTVAQRLDYDIASWSELATLDPALITIGSHSASHDIMVGMNAGTLDREVVASKARIEEMLGRPVDYFCYPNGDFDAAAHAHVRATYAAAVSTRAGAVESHGYDRHALPRLAVAPGLPSLALQMALG
jgi:peptidoglycan/xylan/chitin deacetylase (PgdA/CDA1 family)